MFSVHLRLCILTLFFVAIPFTVSDAVQDASYHMAYRYQTIFAALEVLTMALLLFFRPSEVQRKMALLIGGGTAVFVLLSWGISLMGAIAMSG